MTSRRVWKSLVTWVVVVASVCVVVSTALVVPSTFAVSPAASPAAPQPVGGIAECRGPQISKHCTDQDPRFLALKNAYRIMSGVSRGQAKGTKSSPYVSDAPVVPGTPAPPPMSATAGTTRATPRHVTGTPLAPYVGAAPMTPNTPAQPHAITYTWGDCGAACGELSISSYVQHVWEPGGGYYYNNAPNFGSVTPSYDDASTNYGDRNMYNLCGPGAADVALWYWPWPPNTSNHSATDPWNNTTTYWKGQDPYDLVYRLRGYMVQLAWNIRAPTWNTAGLMQGSTATIDSVERDGLNWEASGENTSTWQNYFYVIASPGTSSTFHSDVVSDISTGNVPVVVLLNAQGGLPNWGSGGLVGHYITIVGYNDSSSLPNGPEYAYMDTCGFSTGCNSYSANSDGGVKRATQSRVWNAITSYGDWIW